MANTGKGAAYLQLRPLRNTAGQDARYWADEAFRRRQEERIAENQRLNRQAEAEKERNSRRDKYMKFIQPYDTKSQSMNEVVGRVIREGNEEIGRIANKLVSGDFKDSEEETKLRVKLNNLQNLPEKMKMVTDSLTTRHDEVMKLKESGAIKDNDNFKNYEKVFQMGAEGFQGIIDDNGNPAIAYRDLDGDGIMDVEGFDEISQGLSAFKFDKNIDVDKLATNLVSGLGTKKTVTDDNYLKRTIEGPDPKALEFATYAAMINREGDLTDAGKSFMEDLGLTDTLDNRDILMEEWKKIVDSKVDFTDEEDFDYGARTGAIREGRLGRDADNKDNNVVISAIEGRDGITSTNAEVQDYGFNDNGDLILQVSVPKTKSITKNDFSELERKAAAGDENAQQQLELAQVTGDGGAKIVIPGENETRTITVQKKDERWVSERLGATDRSKKISPDVNAPTGAMSSEQFKNFLKRNNLQ